MDLGLNNQVAIVTGGARGIGAAIACGLADEGCDVAVVDCAADAGPLRRHFEARGRRLLSVAADVADFSRAEQVAGEVARELGRLDILVCNAGITRDAVIWKLTEDQWDAVLNVNLKGYFNYIRAAAPVLKQQRRGRIVNITSINGMRGKFAQANYAAAKGGIIALTKTVAREMGKFNVTVNAVAPGMVKTEMAERLPADVLDGAVRETMVGRLAEPRDIADAVAFLCSARARHITGEVLRVDGGQYI